MSSRPDSERISRQGNTSPVGVISAPKGEIGHGAHQWFSEAINRHNLTLLAMISAFLAGMDTFQSFYLQRVINQFNEVNLLPMKFYSHGLTGYLLYAPVDFLALFFTLTILWIWASYLVWYCKLFILPRLR